MRRGILILLLVASEACGVEIELDFEPGLGVLDGLVLTDAVAPEGAKPAAADEGARQPAVILVNDAYPGIRRGEIIQQSGRRVIRSVLPLVSYLDEQGGAASHLGDRGGV